MAASKSVDVFKLPYFGWQSCKYNDSSIKHKDCFQICLINIDHLLGPIFQLLPTYVPGTIIRHKCTS